jgi:uncharacterized repeat protein (TIGR03833 family)
LLDLGYCFNTVGKFEIVKIKEQNMEGTVRSNIKPGLRVEIIQKKDQRTGKVTEGVVKDILTSAPKHTWGIKVRLQTGEIGRVQNIMDDL